MANHLPVRVLGGIVERERSHFGVVGQRINVVNGIDSIAVTLDLSNGARLATVDALLTIGLLFLGGRQLLILV